MEGFSQSCTAVQDKIHGRESQGDRRVDKAHTNLQGQVLQQS